MTVDGKAYYRCPRCRARFLDPARRPTAGAEFAEYEKHQNEPSDPRYRAFLSRLADPLLARLAPHSHGLDFGCGPGPALAAMLEEAGHVVDLYDPFYQPRFQPARDGYDFITCTEVIEHCHHPRDELRRLDGHLKRGGILAVMTCLQSDDARFANWHYRRDPTHVVFYREATFEWIARTWRWTLDFPARDVAFLVKP